MTIIIIIISSYIIKQNVTWYLFKTLVLFIDIRSELRLHCFPHCSCFVIIADLGAIRSRDLSTPIG